jgi:type 1 glutamine amidotransferase
MTFDHSLTRRAALRSAGAAVGLALVSRLAIPAEAPPKTRILLILGGWFNFEHSKLNVGNSQLMQAAPDHPICRGWKPYDIHDEFYLHTKFDPKAVPVLTVNVNGNDEVVAWVLERPDSNGGRSFGFALGHFHENFAIQAFRRAIVNGILWTAHVDVPADGAPVNVTEKDLKLPPKD